MPFNRLHTWMYRVTIRCTHYIETILSVFTQLFKLHSKLLSPISVLALSWHTLPWHIAHFIVRATSLYYWFSDQLSFRYLNLGCYDFYLLSSYKLCYAAIDTSVVHLGFYLLAPCFLLLFLSFQLHFASTLEGYLASSDSASDSDSDLKMCMLITSEMKTDRSLVTHGPYKFWALSFERKHLIP